MINRIVIFSILSATLSNLSIAQQKGTTRVPSSGLPSLQSVLESQTFARFLFELRSIADEFAPFPPNLQRSKSTMNAIADLDTFLMLPPAKDKIAEFKLVQKHKKRIIGLLENLKGKDFIYSEKDIPIRFALTNGKPTILLGIVESDKVYNTLRMPLKSRAAQVISSLLLPMLPEINTAFSASGIKYYGVIAVYRSRDFSDDSQLSTKGEMVALVVDSDKCKKFSDTVMTEDELIETSDVYLCDSDMYLNFRKIKVSLE